MQARRRRAPPLRAGLPPAIAGCARWTSSARDDEREDEAEQRECLGEGDAEEHGGAHHACGLGLAGHGGDGVADDDADADAGADGGAAVDDASADGSETGLELALSLLSEDLQHGVLLLGAR